MAEKVSINQIKDALLAYLPNAWLDPVDKAYIVSARVHQGKRRLSGEPYLIHPLAVAYILTQLKQNESVIAAALLHDVIEDSLTPSEEILENFGEEIAVLVDGVTKISKISFSSKKEAEAENFRKMLFAMNKDVRVILIKLADRLHNMRTIQHHREEKRIEIAQETMDIYAPIANRMGIFWIKSELEDLCLSAQKPDAYEDLNEKLKANKAEYEKYIKDVSERLRTALTAQGIKAEIQARIKHLHSIHKKLEKLHLDFDELHDIIAFRVIVDNIRTCYEALGVINNLWKPVPGRMKDYIALPKPNMYQSLHTTVIGEFGDRLEVQIRTWEMHMVAEQGVAAHWRYKEGAAIDKGDRAFAWLRQMMEWQQDQKDPQAFIEGVKVDLFPEDVYVFTPKGDVKALPRGSTPLDFAYSVHTEVGNHVSVAKVNGRVVPFKYELQNGDRVEVITQQNHQPSEDWLKFVKTNRAKSKIQHFISQKKLEQSVELGKQILDKEFRKYGRTLNKMIKSDEFDKALKMLSMKNPESVFAGVGFGRIKKEKIIAAIVPEEELKKHEVGEKPKESAFDMLIKKVSGGDTEVGVRVSGEDGFMIRFAKCCEPLPGDSIVGYITRGRGVTVHRFNCGKLVGVDDERRIPVEWSGKAASKRPVRIAVVCADQPGLLAAISRSLSSSDVNISRADIRSTENKRARCTFEFSVDNLDHLKTIMKNIEKIKGIISVERLQSSAATQDA